MNNMNARILEWQDLARKNEEEKRKAEIIQEFVSRIPRRFRGKTLADFLVEHENQSRIKQISEKFVITFSDRLKSGANLHFLGMPGTGKTFLALIMCQSIVLMGYSVHYESSLQFLKVLLEKRYESNAAYQILIDYYKRIQFLVLDEITESVTKDGEPSEVERQMLFDVINARYEQENLCTLIISNRDKAELKSRLGCPIIDRLSEKGITLIFDWDSYRNK